MDMREAFENYVLSLKPFQVLTPHQAWQAACEWQKQKDAEICKTLTVNGVKADQTGYCADVILNPGKDNG